MPRSFLSERVTRAMAPANDWALAASAARRAGTPLLDLSVSNPLLAFPDRDWRAIREALGDVPLDVYAPSGLGNIAAREGIAEYLSESVGPAHAGFFDQGRGRSISPSRLMLTASTSESYAYLFKLLTNPGDRLLVPSPSYPLLEHLAAFESLEIVQYELGYDGAWYVDMDSFRRGMAREPAAAVIVTPNNPTASCLSSSEFDALAAFGVPLIVDQVFAPYCLERGQGRSSPSFDGPSLVFVLDGLSKRCALPQLKLGWVSVAGEARRVASAMEGLDLIGDTYLSVSSPSEGAAGPLLRQSGPVICRICARLDVNLRRFACVLGPQAPVSVLNYEGGWSAMVRLPSHTTEEVWSQLLLSAGVLAQPGWLYDCSLPATFVLSLITPEATFEEGLVRIREVVSRHG